jgi:hypothetical protein
MNRTSVLLCLVLCAVAVVTAGAQPAADPGIPRLERRGQATQLMVDGQPWLVLGGEAMNTASSDLAYMKTVWPQMARLNLNTVLVGVSWSWVEPVEGRFDFALIDGLLDGARQNNLRVVFLWFGSWKNGISSFAPAWVKADQQRFPRVQIASGSSIEVLSAFSEANREADARAYTAFVRHLKEVDGKAHTCLMIQMQNEVGILGDSRDRGAAATAAFAGAVPKELTSYLSKNQTLLNADLAKRWAIAGRKTAGTWEDVFGAGTATDEIFMAWHYARYMERLTAAGKAEYPLPVFTNTWIVQPEDRGPGDYPTGGPEPFVLDIWKAGAPSIDLNAPDVYLPNFTDWAGWFHRVDNPLFVPESFADAAGVANAFYAIGEHAGLGYSPFGIDRLGSMKDSENLPLAKGYALLRQMTPLILDAQAKGTIAAASLTVTRQKRSVPLGDYTVNFDVKHNRRNPTQAPMPGYGLVVAAGPGEYFVAGTDIEVTFTPRTPGPEIAGLATVEAGRFENGTWIPNRQLSGDDVLLDYDLAGAAARRQSGSGLRFDADGPTVQRVTLYRYR